MPGMHTGWLAKWGRLTSGMIGLRNKQMNYLERLDDKLRTKLPTEGILSYLSVGVQEEESCSKRYIELRTIKVVRLLTSTH
jgi:hypothetical protein